MSFSLGRPSMDRLAYQPLGSLASGERPRRTMLRSAEQPWRDDEGGGPRRTRVIAAARSRGLGVLRAEGRGPGVVSRTTMGAARPRLPSEGRADVESEHAKTALVAAVGFDLAGERPVGDVGGTGGADRDDPGHPVGAVAERLHADLRALPRLGVSQRQLLLHRKAALGDRQLLLVGLAGPTAPAERKKERHRAGGAPFHGRILAGGYHPVPVTVGR